MKKGKWFLAMGLFLAAAIGLPRVSLANKASVTIEAPKTAAPGTEITIKVHVSHNGNNAVHHVEWVYVSINGKELERWEFSALNLPEDGNFIREVKYKVVGPVTIEAKANCNLHGSAGPADLTVKPK